MTDLAHRSRTRNFKGAAFGSALMSSLLLLMAPTPASASQSTYGDATADAPSSIDITSVSVELTNREVRLKLRIAELETEQGAWRVYIDTPRAGSPNYLVGLDMHYTFGETDGWRLLPNGMDPWGNIRCSNGGRAQVDRDVVTFRFKRSCIKNPRRIRVAVESSLYVGGPPDYAEEFEYDYLVGRRELTPWVSMS